VPDWDNQKALTIFEQMLEKSGNKIDGVLGANDSLGNAAISALKQRKLPQIPVTGQDATLQGIQNIVTGDQRTTVYKAIKKEADAAAKIAIALVKGETPQVSDKIDNGSKTIPAQFETPGRRDQGQYRGLHRRARLPHARGRLRREARLQVQGDRTLRDDGARPGGRAPTPRFRRS
jgi:ABC-type xylose transport system substrate-binding protein